MCGDLHPFLLWGGSRYFIIFVDDYSRFTWIYLLHNRSDILSIYKNFVQMIKNQFSKTIKVFRSDNAQEYKSHDFLSYLQQNGTIAQYSCPGTSQQNGLAEHKHHQILNSVRAMLLFAKIPEQF